MARFGALPLTRLLILAAGPVAPVAAVTTPVAARSTVTTISAVTVLPTRTLLFNEP